MNETKSFHITFTSNKNTRPQVFIKTVSLPQVTSVKYLGLHLDQTLTWRSHILFGTKDNILIKNLIISNGFLEKLLNYHY